MTNLIHIKELFRLQSIQNLRLIAGQEGLERTVTAAVLFEYDPSRMQLPDFYRGDLVVTTLAYARGDALLVAHSLQALMNQESRVCWLRLRISANCRRRSFRLPISWERPCSSLTIPILKRSSFRLLDLIRGKRHFAGYEPDLDALMRGELTEEQRRERARKIDPVGQEIYRIYAVCPLERMPMMDDKIYELLEKDADAAHRYTFMEWRRMILVISREEKADAQESLSRMENVLTAQASSEMRLFWV